MRSPAVQTPGVGAASPAATTRTRPPRPAARVLQAPAGQQLGPEGLVNVPLDDDFIIGRNELFHDDRPGLVVEAANPLASPVVRGKPVHGDVWSKALVMEHASKLADIACFDGRA